MDLLIAVPRPTPEALPGPRAHTRRLLLLRLADEESKGRDCAPWEGMLATLGQDADREALRPLAPAHQVSRAHPWAEHRQRKRRGNWDERATTRSAKHRRHGQSREGF